MSPLADRLSGPLKLFTRNALGNRDPTVADLVRNGSPITAGMVAPFLLISSGPSLEDARRECRTAMNDEMSDRATLANADTDYVVGSITGIELQESEETDDGYVIYGEAHVEITAAFGQSAHSSVLLECTARIGDGGAVETSVSNR